MDMLGARGVILPATAGREQGKSGARFPLCHHIPKNSETSKVKPTLPGHYEVVFLKMESRIETILDGLLV